MRFLPASATPTAKLILISRSVRAVADGCISVLLPAYLLALGFGVLQVGLLTTATLLGSALLTLTVGLYGGRAGVKILLSTTSLLMLATGIGFAVQARRLKVAFWSSLNLPWGRAGLSTGGRVPRTNRA